MTTQPIWIRQSDQEPPPSDKSSQTDTNPYGAPFTSSSSPITNLQVLYIVLTIFSFLLIMSIYLCWAKRRRRRARDEGAGPGVCGSDGTGTLCNSTVDVNVVELTDRPPNLDAVRIHMEGIGYKNEENVDTKVGGNGD